MNANDIIKLLEADPTFNQNKTVNGLIVPDDFNDKIKKALNVKKSIPPIRKPGTGATLRTSKANLSGSKFTFDMEIVDKNGNSIAKTKYNGSTSSKKIFDAVEEFCKANGETKIATKLEKIRTKKLAKLTKTFKASAIMKFLAFLGTKIGGTLAIALANMYELMGEYAAMQAIFGETYDGDFNEFKKAYDDMWMAKWASQAVQFAIEIVGMLLIIIRGGRLISLIRALRVLTLGGGPWGWLIALLITLVMEAAIWTLSWAVNTYGEDMILWYINDAARESIGGDFGKTETTSTELDVKKLNKALRKDMRDGNTDRETIKSIADKYSGQW